MIMASRDLQEHQKHPQLASTCSMHIFTKAGTVVESLWHRSDRLQPNTWSGEGKHRRESGVWGTPRGEDAAGTTFDVALVSDGLQRRPAGQELLQLVAGFLVVGGVHAGGGLHGCGEEKTGQRCPPGVVLRWFPPVLNATQTSALLGVPVLFVLLLHRRLGHVLLDGLVRLPGLMRTSKDIVTVGDPS